MAAASDGQQEAADAGPSEVLLSLRSGRGRSSSPSSGPWLGPVPARRPTHVDKPGCLLHAAVWDGDVQEVERLVTHKGEVTFFDS